MVTIYDSQRDHGRKYCKNEKASIQNISQLSSLDTTTVTNSLAVQQNINEIEFEAETPLIRVEISSDSPILHWTSKVHSTDGRVDRSTKKQVSNNDKRTVTHCSFF